MQITEQEKALILSRRKSGGMQKMWGGQSYIANACLPGGDAQCDGYIEDGERFGGQACDCLCHWGWDGRAEDEPNTTAEMLGWHKDELFAENADAVGIKSSRHKKAATTRTVHFDEGFYAEIVCYDDHTCDWMTYDSEGDPVDSGSGESTYAAAESAAESAAFDGMAQGGSWI